jgi:hypothetical protein
MVKVAPGFDRTPLATNGYSDLILELYGPEVGAHARSSIGMISLNRLVSQQGVNFRERPTCEVRRIPLPRRW